MLVYRDNIFIRLEDIPRVRDSVLDVYGSHDDNELRIWRRHNPGIFES